MDSIWQSLKVALGIGMTPRRARKRPALTASANSGTRADFRGCTIQPGQDSCASVTQLRKKRFLQKEVPRLPLPDCGRLQCDCRYQRHEDRRHQDDDRRLPGAAATQLYPHSAKERRRVNGRRAQD